MTLLASKATFDKIHRYNLHDSYHIALLNNINITMVSHPLYVSSYHDDNVQLTRSIGNDEHLTVIETHGRNSYVTGGGVKTITVVPSPSYTDIVKLRGS